MQTFRLHNLGCKANAHDGELVRASLLASGLREARPGEPAGLVIINSCTVTDAADRESRQLASRAGLGPGAPRVVVTGCAAELDPQGLAAAPGVRFVVGNQDKPTLVERVLAAVDAGDDDGAPRRGEVLGAAAPYPTHKARHPPERAWPQGLAAFPPLPAAGAHTRALLKVQEGCDAFCTFCVIPYARGPARSLAADEAVARARALLAAGARELVLTGTALGAWGDDLAPPSPLEALVERLLGETDVARLRLGSLAPEELTPGLLDLLRDAPALCPHVHLSLQSLDGDLLRRMGRRTTPDAAARALEALAAIGRARAVPGGLFVGVDLIAGFPGESDAAFAQQLATLDALPWTRLHAFPYSERAGTAATRLPHPVAPPARRERVTALVAHSNARALAAAERLVREAGGHPVEVLVEGRPLGGGPRAGGHTANYFSVAFEAAEPAALRNRLVAVVPEGATLHGPSGNALVHGRLVGTKRPSGRFGGDPDGAKG